MLKDRTKALLAQTLEDMLGEMAFSKVRVTDLCKRADVQKQVFYYHFRDKYDLAAWVFERDFEDSFPQLPAGAEVTEALIEKMTAEQFERLWARRGMYRRFFEDGSFGSVRDYVHEFDVELNRKVLSAYLGVQSLGPAEDYLAKFAAHGFLGVTMDWLRGEIPLSPLELARLQQANMPELLRHAHAEQYRARKARC